METIDTFGLDNMLRECGVKAINMEIKLKGIYKKDLRNYLFTLTHNITDTIKTKKELCHLIILGIERQYKRQQFDIMYTKQKITIQKREDMKEKCKNSLRRLINYKKKCISSKNNVNLKKYIILVQKYIDELKKLSNYVGD